MLEKLVFFVIFVIVGIILITGQAMTITANAKNVTSDARTSQSAATIYNLYDFIWANKISF